MICLPLDRLIGDAVDLAETIFTHKLGNHRCSCGGAVFEIFAEGVGTAAKIGYITDVIIELNQIIQHGTD